jgi:hypothetical protein
MTLVWRPGFQFDTDASTYIEAVEAADTQALETGVRYAINDFVIGCKQDGIWSAIKAGCILAGARTLAGALTPLAGTAPTNFNFVSADYNRETGLKGDGSTKYLNANRNHNADPQNNRHMAVYATEKSGATVRALMGTASTVSRSVLFANSASDLLTNCADGTNLPIPGAYTLGTGLIGVSRSTSAGYNVRASNITFNNAISSIAPASADLFVFSRSVTPSLSSPRLTFYSIGESLDLALLDTRVTALVTAIGAAIP